MSNMGLACRICKQLGRPLAQRVNHLSELLLALEAAQNRRGALALATVASQAPEVRPGRARAVAQIAPPRGRPLALDPVGKL
jgi:hypothetical protein